MKILVLHRIPYSKILYDRGIDHEKHDVTYIGIPSILKTIPSNLRCKKIARPGFRKTSVEVIDLIKDDPNYDCVISLSEYELIDAAEVREAYGISGTSTGQVLKVRDKVLMKKIIHQAGIRAPRFMPCDDFLTGEYPTQWSGLTVLKPRDGASSENVMIFDNPDDITTFIYQGAPGIKGFFAPQYEIEEYVQGPVMHFDGLVSNGKVISLLASEYLGTCLNYAKGFPLGSVQIELTQEMQSWAISCIEAIDIQSGAFHLEAIRSHDGLVFLEIANRVGGADVVNTFELTTGIHLPSEELKIILSSVPGSEPYKPQFSEAKIRKMHGWFVFPGHHLPDVAFKVRGLKYLKNHPMINRFCHLDESKRLPRNITYQSFEVPVAGIIEGESSEAMLREMRNIFSTVYVITNVVPDHTKLEELCLKSTAS